MYSKPLFHPWMKSSDHDGQPNFEVFGYEDVEDLVEASKLQIGVGRRGKFRSQILGTIARKKECYHLKILLNFVHKRDNPWKRYPQPFQAINLLIDEKGRDGRKGSEMKEGRPHSRKVARLYIQCYQWRNSFVFSLFFYTTIPLRPLYHFFVFQIPFLFHSTLSQEIHISRR